MGYALAELIIQQPGYADSVLVGALVGLIVGIMQAFVLWNRISQVHWWVLSCLAGWAVGLTITWAFTSGGNLAQSFLDEYLIGITVGLFLGNTQWFILRRQIRRSSLWVMVSVVGWTFSLKIGVWIMRLLDLDFKMNYGHFLILEQAIEGTIAGAILGMITGGAFFWLFRFTTAPNQLQISAPSMIENDGKMRIISLTIIITMLFCFIPSWICTFD